MTPWRRLWASWQVKPAATTLPVGMILLGADALILGDRASKAFTNLGGATLIRVLGFLMLLGGAVVLAGIMRADAVLEPLGLMPSTLGCAMYGAGVIMGLGWQGSIAGGFALLAAIGFAGRIRLLIRSTPPDVRE